MAQLGVDAHWRDPLTHLALTTHGFESLFQRIHDLSPRWLAVGGGGYHQTVVPRTWTLAWGVMSGQTFPNVLPETVAAHYNPPFLHDEGQPPIVVDQRHQIQQDAANVVEMLKQHLQF